MGEQYDRIMYETFGVSSKWSKYCISLNAIMELPTDLFLL
jgi:hypothetical protein